MANSSLPFDIDALEKLIRDGTRLIEVTRPVWSEIGKMAEKVPPRRYLPIVAGVAAVALLGAAAASASRRRGKAHVVEPTVGEDELEVIVR